MQVTIQYRNATDHTTASEKIELPSGFSACELAEKLRTEKEIEVAKIILNGKLIAEDIILQDGDEVMLIPVLICG